MAAEFGITLLRNFMELMSLVRLVLVDSTMQESEVLLVMEMSALSLLVYLERLMKGKCEFVIFRMFMVVVSYLSRFFPFTDDSSLHSFCFIDSLSFVTFFPCFMHLLPLC